MARKPRDLKPNYCYHITVRCNNREFKLIRHEVVHFTLGVYFRQVIKLAYFFIALNIRP